MLQDRLLETAIDQFGRLGFDGASTRDIAQASGTAMSSITYHFGGKEGLYLAAADHIAKCLRERLEKAAGQAEMGLPDSRDAAIERLLLMLDTMCDLMLHPESESWSRFIVREQQEPTEAFERLYQGAMRGVLETALELLAIARPDMTRRQARAQAVLFLGMVLVMRTGRASVTRVLDVDAIGPEEADLLHARLRATALTVLKGANA